VGLEEARQCQNLGGIRGCIMAQAVESLSSKQKGLNSNPSTAKKDL
jgi:hypothetical protein